MPSYSVAEAKNTLPRLIDRAIAGEEVIITRHGKVVAEVKGRSAFNKTEWQAAIEKIAAERREGPRIDVGSVQLLGEMYDETPW